MSVTIGMIIAGTIILGIATYFTMFLADAFGYGVIWFALILFLILCIFLPWMLFGVFVIFGFAAFIGQSFTK